MSNFPIDIHPMLGYSHPPNETKHRKCDMSDKTVMPKEMQDAILNVMREFGSLRKTEFNQHGRYQFAPIDDFYDVTQRLLPKHGLILLSSEIESELIPLNTGTENAVKVTVWIKTKWQFKICHNGVVYDDGLFRFSMVPSSGAQTEGIAQSYAAKNFLRELFKVPTGEYELDDMPIVEHGSPEGAVQNKAKESNKQATKSHKDTASNPTPQEIARGIYNEIVREDITEEDLNSIKKEIDRSVDKKLVTVTQSEPLRKTLHYRERILTVKVVGDVEKLAIELDKEPDFIKAGLTPLLTVKTAEVSAAAI